MLNNIPAGSTRPIGTQDYIGWGIWVLGMVFEVVADFQKSSFKANPDNKVKNKTIN
jgi:steroid 5-alpha reductase family enzyme